MVRYTAPFTVGPIPENTLEVLSNQVPGLLSTTHYLFQQMSKQCAFTLKLNFLRKTRGHGIRCLMSQAVKQMTNEKPITCGVCNGTGDVYNASLRTCVACGGRFSHGALFCT